MIRSKLLWLLILLTLSSSTGVVYAQEPEREVTDDDVNRVARELYCPICENTPLDVCETQACEDWRALIREKLAAGQSDQEIVEYFAGIYGERARATPTTRGLSLAVWLAPVIGSLIVALYFARLLRRWLAQGPERSGGRGAATQRVAVPKPTLRLHEQDELDDYVARLEREIHESS